MENFFYGKSAKYRIGTVPVVYGGNKGWSVDPSVEDLRTDNTADNGFSNRIAGINDLPWTIEHDWDADNNPMDDPPALYPGSVLTDLRLYLDQLASGAIYFGMPKAIVLGTPVNAMIDAIVHITVNGANKGAYTKPLGEFAPSAAATM